MLTESEHVVTPIHLPELQIERRMFASYSIELLRASRPSVDNLDQVTFAELLAELG